MSQRIRIGNQTAISCADPLEPFEFALRRGFDAFEWFADKKVNKDGTTVGWDESDMDATMRAWIRNAGQVYDVLFTVHAPWQANPLKAGGVALLLRSLDFARDLGAGLVNLHLYMDDGPRGYVEALEPVLRAAERLGVRISIENTPHTTPADFNQTFAWLHRLGAARPGHVGMCLDIGHANLCAPTHNDFVRYLDELDVPIMHMHVHENRGDADSHLTLFTGPAGEDDSGIRALLARLRQRHYEGAMILEQWPNPPELLTEAETRLRELLGEPRRDGRKGLSDA
jgi:sugar phosphate isomerase/epimerase